MMEIAFGVAIGIAIGNIVFESLRALAIEVIWRYHDRRLNKIRDRVRKEYFNGR